jgi:hypothetical protein
MKVGDLVRLETDNRIGIITRTDLRWKGFVEVLFNNDRQTQVQPDYLEVINEIE